ASSPLSLVANQAGQPLAFLDLDTILVREADGALAAVSTTSGTTTMIVGDKAGQFPLAATANTGGRQIAFTLSVAGRLQVYLANDDGTGVVSLTGFSAKLPLDAGPPSFVGS
ncbi:MAG TPA: hypothetical protein VMV09_00485, partial [Candidatus Saccharimonadales bacterium]|nr:hypothetical protein [Candidatus Saccharimonadales bacterium]